MQTDQIIKELNKFQARLFVRRDGEVLPADPVTLSNNLLLIRGLLIQLVDKVAESERTYRHAKAKKFDELIQPLPQLGEKPQKGLSKSAAMDALEMVPELIEMKVDTERVRNFMKYTDGLCTSIQSVLKVQAGSEKAQY